MMFGTILLSADGKLVIHKRLRIPTHMPAVQHVLGPGVRNSILSGGLGAGTGLQGLGHGLQKVQFKSLITVSILSSPQRQPLWSI